MAFSCAILGASGYTGGELCRLLAEDSDFECKVFTADSHAGESIVSLFPHLDFDRSILFKKVDDVRTEIEQCDVVFCGLPHGEAMRVLPTLKNRLVIDLGGDFRLPNAKLYENWYGKVHLAPSELGSWVYGLPELFRSEIKRASRIANPGCFATASILALAPLLKHALVEGPCTIDAMTGTSGGGRGAQSHLQFSAIHEDVRAYKVGVHQHTPEIEYALQKYSGRETLVSFTPHLVPMSRGIHATCSARARASLTRAEMVDAFRAAYEHEPFVQIATQPPGTRELRGSNRAVVYPFLDERTGRVIVISVIDNLVKGASGQAIQNALCALGLDETAYLPRRGLSP